MRLLLIGAFPFPYPQGSQVFAAEQARALAHTGAQVAIASYGSGEGELPPGVEWIPSSRGLAPANGRSGPALSKLLADAALVATVVRAQRARRFDFALAHNAEAALVAAAAGRITGLPHIYVAHTLLAEELSSYAPARYRVRLERLGRRIDRLVARNADAVIALSQAGLRALQAHARGPVELIPPGLAQRDAPDAREQREACLGLGLEPGHFFLYTGNLDGYQELELLDAAAAALGPDAPPVVVATHDARGSHRFPSLQVVEASFETARALAFEAAVLVLTRRRTGGFPIKLLNYMETGRPILAFEGVAEGLLDDRTARLLPSTAGPDAIADALRELYSDPERSARIGERALQHLRTSHDWTDLAQRTRALITHLSRPRGRYTSLIGDRAP